MTGTPPQVRWASIEAASAYASISRSTTYRLIARGHVAATKIGTRRLVDLDSLDRHLERCGQDLASLGKPGEVGLSLAPD